MKFENKTTPDLIAIIANVDHAGAMKVMEDRGGLAGLYSTDTRQIEKIKGFTKKRSEKLGASIELAKRLESARKPRAKKFTDALDVWNMMGHEMKFLQKEEFRVLLLGGRNELLKTVTISKGKRNSCMVHCSDIFREALLESACAIILVHNHPIGDPSPSPEDCAMTRRVVSGGELLGISVLDHIIIGEDGYTSMREEGLIQ